MKTFDTSFYKILAALLFSVIFFPSVGLSGESIRIAAVYSMTGDKALSSLSSVDGVRYAVKDINSRGGVQGKPIELVIFNTFSRPIGAGIAARKAVESGAVAIVGAAFSSLSLVVARIAQGNRIPMVSSVSTYPGLTKIGDCIFRICANDYFQGRLLASFAFNDLKARTGIIIQNITSDYSMDLAGEFKKNFTAKGGRIVLEKNYITDVNVLRTLTNDLRGKTADLVFIPGHHESGYLASSLQSNRFQGGILGGDGWGTSAFFKMGGKNLAKGYYSTHWCADENPSQTKSFQNKHKISDELDANMVLAYDAVTLLADALARAGYPDRENLRKALASTRDFKGLTGKISLDKNGDAMKKMVMMEVKNGRSFYLKSIAPNQNDEN